MVFAQPVLIGDKEGINHAKVVIYLDNSWSMSNEIDEGVTALDGGVQLVEEIINLYPNNTQYLLITNDFAPFSNTFKSKDEISDLITELEFSSNSRKLNSIRKRINSQNQQLGNTSFEIFWISDFQISSTSEIQLLKQDTINQNHLLPLVFTSESNVFIDSVFIDNPFVTSNQRSVLSVKVRNQNEVAVEDLLLNIFLDGVQSATASIDLPPNGLGVTQFDLGFALNKTMNGRVSFEEYPVTFDNDFFFTINPVAKIEIVEVKISADETSIQKVYGNEEIFNLKASNISNLDYSLLSAADLIVINEIDQLDQALLSTLSDLIGKSANIIIFPSENIDVASYQSLIKSRLLSKSDTLIQRNLSTPDFNNPFFANVFEDESRNFVMPYASSVLSWGLDSDAILKYADSSPFLSGFSGSGIFYLFASPLKDDFTNFHRHAIFVPVMYKIASSSLKEQTDLYYSVSDPVISLKIDGLQRDNLLKLVRDEKEIIPAQRIAGNEVFMDIPKFSLEAGYYDITYNNQNIGSVSFNHNKAESLMAQYNPDDINSMFAEMPNIEIFHANSPTEIITEIKERYLGVPLWKYALILALIFLLAEIALIRFL